MSPSDTFINVLASSLPPVTVFWDPPATRNSVTLTAIPLPATLNSVILGPVLDGLRPRRPTFWNRCYSLKRLRYSRGISLFSSLLAPLLIQACLLWCSGRNLAWVTPRK